MAMSPAPVDSARVKKDFPILERLVHGKRLVYLDSAASSQKPASVIEAMSRYYETTHANVHRGVYALAEEATRLFEDGRAQVARFIGAPSSSEVVFTKNVTEAINLVAYSWGRANLQAGDVVVLTEMEHHSNLVPWLALASERGVQLRFLGITDEGLLDLSNLEETLDGAKLLGVTSVSNVLGTINPIRQLADAAHAAGALILADAAQHAPHLPADVRQLDVDFFGITGHKMLGPTGIGALWARAELLEAMPPFLGGGEMIRDVRLDGFTTNDVPWKFEAGTPPIAEVVGLSVAIDYLKAIGMEAVREHERHLTGVRHCRSHRALPRPDHPRSPRRLPAGRGRIVPVQGRPSSRSVPGPRRSRGVRAGGPPLRQAPDAAAGGRGHGAGVFLGVQR